MKDVSDLVDLEKNEKFKPMAFDFGFTNLPLSELSDRDFEVLSYLLIRNEIENGTITYIDQVFLMQGVSDQGRDCVGYVGGKIKTIIQCKKYSKKITRPQVLKELIKFLLYSLSEPEVKESKCIDYHLYLSCELNGPASKLIESFREEINKEFENGNVNKYIDQNVDEFESFSKYLSVKPYGEIHNLLEKTEIKVSTCTDLSSRIQNDNKLLSQFFNVKSVIDIDTNRKHVQEVIAEELDGRGLHYLTDSDLKDLQSLISDVPKDKRFGFGIADFYGYHEDIFKSIDKDKYQNILDGISKINSTLDELQFDFLQAKLLEIIEKNITQKLVKHEIIHPFFVQLAAQYISIRVPLYFSSRNILSNKQTKEELLQRLIDNLKNDARKYFDNDYSNLTGTLEDINLRVKFLLPQLYFGIDSYSQFCDVLNSELSIALPHIYTCENLIKNYFFDIQTVVIKSFNLSDPRQIKKAKKGFDKMK